MDVKIDMSGLKTEVALKNLISEIKVILDRNKWTKDRWKNLLTNSLWSHNENSLFPWPNVSLTFLFVILLLINGITEKDAWLISEAVFIFLLLVGNVAVNVYNLFLTEVEMHRRMSDIASKLEMNLANGINWSEENYPHLHTPLSASVVLQWTIRDGRKINLPWALLVKNDLIYLKPGQVSPGRCISADNPNMIVNKGEILYFLSDNPAANDSPIPEFKPPVEPQLFILDETPYATVVQAVLQRNRLQRPSSLLTKYHHLFFVQLLAQLLAPAALFLTLICNIVRFYQEPKDSPYSGLLLLNPISTALPMISLSFPTYWIVANYIALAKVMNDSLSFRHVHVTDDPFDDTPGHQQPNLILEKAKEASDASSLWTAFFSALFGHGKYLSRSENLIHTLGSITALCCTDKKGILSWPNTSAEKLFILKPDDSPQVPVVAKGEVSSSNSHQDIEPALPQNANEAQERAIVPEILTITHDHRNPFKVDFDDPTWRQYFSSLKPLGLGILLNTCNLSTEEKYTNFFNYLVCESIRLENLAHDQQ